MTDASLSVRSERRCAAIWRQTGGCSALLPAGRPPGSTAARLLGTRGSSRKGRELKRRRFRLRFRSFLKATPTDCRSALCTFLFFYFFLCLLTTLELSWCTSVTALLACIWFSSGQTRRSVPNCFEETSQCASLFLSLSSVVDIENRAAQY